MCRVLGVVAGLLLASSGMAAQSEAGMPEKKAAVVKEPTSDGTAYYMLSPLAKGPAPTLFLFASGANSTLAMQDYGRVGSLLHAQGWNVISLDVPCHGADVKKGEQADSLGSWAARVAHGENIAAEFSARVNKVLDHLVKAGVADPDRIAAAGISRGGFMAFQAAAANPRIRAVAGFAPVTYLPALSEFSGLKGNALAEQLSLENVAEKLAGGAAWIMIGDHDGRVSTERATAFAKALKQAAEKKKLPARVDLHVVPVPGHTSLPEWHDQAAVWLASALGPARPKSK